MEVGYENCDKVLYVHTQETFMRKSLEVKRGYCHLFSS